MSAAGSSGKRKRGPKKKPQSTPEPLMWIPKRHIHYSDREHLPDPKSIPIPVELRRIQHHNILQFSRDTKEFVAREKYLQFGVLQHRTIDDDLLDTLGQEDKIKKLLGKKWISALKCDWSQYRELTVEFYSTLQYSYKKFSEPNAVSFSLGRQMFEMSVPQFAVKVGFYNQKEVDDPSFASLLRGRYVKAHPQGMTDTQIRDFWSTIGEGEFDDQDVLESQIRDPVLRYIHRILACTIVGRHNGMDKCNMIDLFCLYCMVNGREANLATVLLSSMTRSRRVGKEVQLPLGPYIGRLADRLNVFTRWPKSHLTEGPVTEKYKLADLRLVGICAQDDPPRWAEFGALPAIRQRVRPVIVDGPPRHRAKVRTEQVTLGYIVQRLDQQDAAIRRQNAALRYMMRCQGHDIPDWFASSDEEDTGESDRERLCDHEHVDEEDAGESDEE